MAKGDNMKSKPVKPIPRVKSKATKIKLIPKSKSKSKIVKSKKKSIKRVAKTDADLKKLAEDIYAGRVFTDRDATAMGMGKQLHLIFMPITFLEGKVKTDFIKAKPGLIYEYLHKALPSGINGCPMFISFAYLAEKEFNKVREYYDKIKAAIEGVK
jgi:hypothetical protein